MWRRMIRSRRLETTGVRFISKGIRRHQKRRIHFAVKLGPRVVSNTRVFSRRRNYLISSNTVHVIEHRENRVFTEGHLIVRILSSPIRNYDAKNWITRQTILQVQGGRRVRVTSRPGQSGVVSGVFID